MTRLVEHFRRRHDPLTSLVLTVPVFLVYHLGILLVDRRNGVDWVTDATLALLDRSLWGYVVVTLGYGAGLLGAGLWLRGRASVRPSALGPVLVESLLWGLVMLATVGWATRALFAGPAAAQVGAAPMGPVTRLVMAAGAGFHEELVFRALLFSGGTGLLRRFTRFRPSGAVLAAAAGSSFLFAVAHYIGALGDPFSLPSFTFRFLAGLFLAALYRFRGFAVAVYSHALYDLLVFFVI
ncbi:MAG: type II CAAX prenyl endopeptidase Rce1 family protein [Myxococcota bacterium]